MVARAPGDPVEGDDYKGRRGRAAPFGPVMGTPARHRHAPDFAREARISLARLAQLMLQGGELVLARALHGVLGQRLVGTHRTQRRNRTVAVAEAIPLLWLHSEPIRPAVRMIPWESKAIGHYHEASQRRPAKTSQTTVCPADSNNLRRG